MRSVWSFWTKPFDYDRHRAWWSEKHHLLSWILSLETARRHYPRTWLITDSQGARMLVDGLGLEFESVSTCLDALQDCHPDWWALGKLYAYRCQHDPFVHIDSDVYLWKRLPSMLETADVFAQSPETFPLDSSSWYRPKACVDALNAVGGWVPEEWQWSVDRQCNQAACCGIFGGSHVEFIRHYADLGIKSVEHPDNQDGWSSLGGNMADNLFVEQYSIMACIEFHRQVKNRFSSRLQMQYLFPGAEQAYDPECSRQAGYTHLIGAAKRNRVLAERLERRVRRDYPEKYEACLRYLESVS